MQNGLLVFCATHFSRLHPSGQHRGAFHFEESTADYQEVTIQGQVNYRISDPKKAAAVKVKRAKALLEMDISEAGPAFSDSKTARISGVSVGSLERLRQRVCEVGALGALERVPRLTPPEKDAAFVAAMENGERGIPTRSTGRSPPATLDSN